MNFSPWPASDNCHAMSANIWMLAGLDVTSSSYFFTNSTFPPFISAVM